VRESAADTVIDPDDPAGWHPASNLGGEFAVAAANIQYPFCAAEAKAFNVTQPPSVLAL
jgi:hypothetical protein